MMGAAVDCGAQHAMAALRSNVDGAGQDNVGTRRMGRILQPGRRTGLPASLEAALPWSARELQTSRDVAQLRFGHGHKRSISKFPGQMDAICGQTGEGQEGRLAPAQRRGHSV